MPMTSFLPSPSRSATEGGEAVHCSHMVFVDVGPVAGVQVVVVLLDQRIGPADELAPGEALVLVLAGAVGEVGGCEHRGAVGLEGVDVVVVVGDDDFLLGVVVDVADADVEAIAAVAVLALPVGVRVATRVRCACCSAARPASSCPRAGRACRRARTRRPARRVRGVGRGHHHLDLAVAVEIPGRHAAALGRLAAAGGGRRPARLDGQARRSSTRRRATVPSLPAATMSITPSPSRSATTAGA